MELSSTFKSEIFRPIATIIVPGSFATVPFLFVMANNFPDLITFWDKHDSTTTFFVLLIIIAAGLILEDLGARIEHHVIDTACQRENTCHDGDWYKYLQIAYKEEPIGQRYLRTITLRMKFELAFGLSLIPFWLGTVLYNNKTSYFTDGWICTFSIIFLSLFGYLMFEAYSSAKILSKLRSKLLEKFSGG